LKLRLPSILWKQLKEQNEKLLLISMTSVTGATVLEPKKGAELRLAPPVTVLVK
jgi:hypothetical protein